MAAANKRVARITPEEYLAAENDGRVRHEYVDGVIYAMAGASDRHGLLASAFFVRLYAHLPRRCQTFMSDMKLRVVSGDSMIFYYPDIIVSCDETDRASHWREKPVLLVEVLSASTERIDRTEKLAVYATIPSLLEYVIADQDVPCVELYRRRSGWRRETFGAGEGFTLESVALELTVDSLYERLEF